MAKKSNRNPKLASGFFITVPANDQPVDVCFNRIAVRGQCDSNATEVQAFVYPVAATPDLIPPSGAVRCFRDGDLFYNDFVPHAVGTSLGTINDNLVVAWQRVVGQWQRVPTMIEFIGRSKETATVSAKRSLWFYAAADNYSGWAGAQPAPESGPDYRPYEIDVPPNAQLVSIEATGLWRHNPSASTESGPSGLSGSHPLSQPVYRTFPGGITIQEATPACSHNRLVGMWIVSGQATATEFSIGASLLNEPVPANATKLVLAHHDSYEWSNNSGTVEVRVAFSTLKYAGLSARAENAARRPANAKSKRPRNK